MLKTCREQRVPMIFVVTHLDKAPNAAVVKNYLVARLGFRREDIFVMENYHDTNMKLRLDMDCVILKILQRAQENAQRFLLENIAESAGKCPEIVNHSGEGEIPEIANHSGE